MQEVYHKEKPMDVLWGAWVKGIRLARNSVDIVGIYDEIGKGGKSDFPFKANLKVVLAYQAYPSEFGRTFKVTLNLIDLDGRPLYDFTTRCLAPTLIGESKIRWYESYELKGVVIRDVGYYELGVLVNGEQKQNVPLWVLAPKMVIWNREDDSTTEKWLDE